VRIRRLHSLPTRRSSDLTKSSDLPGTQNGLQKSYNGGVDGFIAEITPNGKSLVRATYLGTDKADQIYGIQTDKQGDVYIGGTTRSEEHTSELQSRFDLVC